MFLDGLVRMLTAFACRVRAAREHRLLEDNTTPVLPNDTEEDYNGHAGAAHRLQDMSDTDEAEEVAGGMDGLGYVTDPRYYSAREEAGLPPLGSERTDSTIVEDPVYEPVAGPSGVDVQWPARALPRLPLSHFRDIEETQVDESSDHTVEILPTPAPRRIAPLGILVRMLNNFLCGMRCGDDMVLIWQFWLLWKILAENIVGIFFI